MPRTAITVTNVTREKTERPAQQVGTTEMNIAANDGRVILEIESTAACIVEVPIPGNVDGGAVASRKYEFTAAGQTAVVGPFVQYVYSQADGTVLINANNTSYKVRAYHV